MGPKERKPFTTKLRADLLRKIKYLAADMSATVNVLLEEAIEDLLVKYESGQGGEPKGVQRVYTLTRGEIEEIVRQALKAIGVDQERQKEESMSQVTPPARRKVEMSDPHGDE